MHYMGHENCSWKARGKLSACPTIQKKMDTEKAEGRKGLDFY